MQAVNLKQVDRFTTSIVSDAAEKCVSRRAKKLQVRIDTFHAPGTNVILAKKAVAQKLRVPFTPNSSPRIGHRR